MENEELEKSVDELLAKLTKNNEDYENMPLTRARQKSDGRGFLNQDSLLRDEKKDITAEKVLELLNMGMDKINDKDQDVLQDTKGDLDILIMTCEDDGLQGKLKKKLDEITKLLPESNKFKPS